MDWTRFANPTADLSWLLDPPGNVPMVGPEQEASVPRGCFDRVAYYRDAFGSHRFVGFLDDRAVAGIQVVMRTGGPATVANVYTVPDMRGQGLASELLSTARRKLGKITHSKHLTESGRRFAARDV